MCLLKKHFGLVIILVAGGGSVFIKMSVQLEFAQNQKQILSTTATYTCSHVCARLILCDPDNQFTLTTFIMGLSGTSRGRSDRNYFV